MKNIIAFILLSLATTLSAKDKMNEDEFWKIIGMLDWKNSGDDELVMQPAVERLSTFSEGDIYEFEDILAEKLHALDGVDYARNIGSESYVSENKYFSPDFFFTSGAVW